MIFKTAKSTIEEKLHAADLTVILVLWWAVTGFILSIILFLMTLFYVSYFNDFQRLEPFTLMVKLKLNFKRQKFGEIKIPFDVSSFCINFSKFVFSCPELKPLHNCSFLLWRFSALTWLCLELRFKRFLAFASLPIKDKLYEIRIKRRSFTTALLRRWELFQAWLSILFDIVVSVEISFGVVGILHQRRLRNKKIVIRHISQRRAMGD